jgi:hypothetical protein
VCQQNALLRREAPENVLLVYVGKHSRIQLRNLLNKNNSVIKCIFNIGASFYTTREQRK